MLKKCVLSLFMAGVACAVTVPRPAGDVPFTLLGKGPDKLENYRGKVVMLMVFITSCPDCQHATKVLSGIQKDYKASGLRVIGLAFRSDDDKAAVQHFIDTYKPGFPVGMIDEKLLIQFGQLTPEMRPIVPMLFFVDRKGVVRSQYFGGDPFMEEEYQDQNIRAKALNILQDGGAAVMLKPPLKPTPAVKK
jgi:thiol-disulfide isomerase/thioredoxin